MPPRKFPSLKAPEFKRMLVKQLGYKTDPDSTDGSHEWLVSEQHPRIRWAFHDNATVAPGLVRSILVNQVGLTLDEAEEVVQGDYRKRHRG